MGGYNGKDRENLPSKYEATNFLCYLVVVLHVCLLVDSCDQPSRTRR